MTIYKIQSQEERKEKAQSSTVKKKRKRKSTRLGESEGQDLAFRRPQQVELQSGNDVASREIKKEKRGKPYRGGERLGEIGVRFTQKSQAGRGVVKTETRSIDRGTTIKLDLLLG